MESSVVRMMLFLAACCLLVPTARDQTADARTDKTRAAPWNILIVVVDTLRYDATSMGGRENTPFLQALARRGVSFARAYSPRDYTRAAHFALLSGFREGLSSPLDRSDLGLPYQASQLGYSTFGVAANGTLSRRTMPLVSGFKEYDCLYDDWITQSLEQKAQRRPAIHKRLETYKARTNDFNEATLFCKGPELLGRLSPMIEGAKEPFFGFVNILEPHDPYLPAPEVLGHEDESARFVDPDIRFRVLPQPLAHPQEITDPARRASVLARIKAAEGRTWSLSDDLSEAQLAVYRQRYYAAVREADRVVRSIFLMLEKRKVLDRTWVVVTSDHGEAFGERGFVTHALSNKGGREATRHVPMVWSLPAALGSGRVVTAPVSLSDVAPTLYDLMGIDWAAIKARSPDNYGDSLLADLIVDSSQTAKRPPSFGFEPTEQARKRMRDDALERLRSLGYIK